MRTIRFLFAIPLLLVATACAQPEADTPGAGAPDEIQAAFADRAAQVADVWGDVDPDDPGAAAAAAAEVGQFVPPSELADGDVGLRGAEDILTVDGATLTFRLGIGACDEDPQPLVYETAVAIVVAGRVTPPDPDTVCTMQLVQHPVTVTLDAPVGERPVVDAFSAERLLTVS